jgi:hypothetical protein
MGRTNVYARFRKFVPSAKKFLSTGLPQCDVPDDRDLQTEPCA